MKTKQIIFTIATFFCTQIIMAQVTSAQETVRDIDGNVYQTIKIGTQVWTRENLRTIRYNDGTPIPRVEDYNQWGELQSPGYCFFGNDSVNKNIYGVFYNWYTVNSGKLAPQGWRIPTKEDWAKLTDFLMENMKQSYMNPSLKRILFIPDMGKSGHRTGMMFKTDHDFNYCWINSEVKVDSASVGLLYLQNGVVLTETRSKRQGFAVRLIKEGESYSNICEAMFKYDTAAVRRMVKGGADLNKPYTYPSYNGKMETRTPINLLYNMKEDHYKDVYGMLLLFINNGLNLDPSEGEKSPVICWVTRAAFSKTEVLNLLQALVDKKADINAVNSFNDNALYCLLLAPSLRPKRDCSEVCEITKFLLDHGADMNMKDHLYGDTPVKRAKKDFNCKELNSLLKSYSKK